VPFPSPAQELGATVKWLLEARRVPHTVKLQPGKVVVTGPKSHKAEIYNLVVRMAGERGIRVLDRSTPVHPLWLEIG